MKMIQNTTQQPALEPAPVIDSGDSMNDTPCLCDCQREEVRHISDWQPGSDSPNYASATCAELC